jgi:hypothetical protein
MQPLRSHLIFIQNKNQVRFIIVGILVVFGTNQNYEIRQ